jgi:FKBP-type peptidyl-prolyl cis-trans isomerase FklB
LIKWVRNRPVLGLTVIVIIGLTCILSYAEDNPDLENEKEKESYSIGYQFGGNLRRQPIDLDLAIIIEGIRDGFEGSGSRLNNEEIKESIAGLKKKTWIRQQKLFHEMLATNLKEGDTFLSQNAKKKGVKTLSSGLQYEVLRNGTGPSPKKTDTVTIHYRGTLVDGTEFDNSYTRGEPTTVSLFGVIQGWTETLQIMNTGAKWRIYVPACLGYGKRRHGSIPPNSVLIFEMELLSIHEGPFPEDALTGHREIPIIDDSPSARGH